MIERLVFHLLSGILGIIAVTRYIPDISFSGRLDELLLVGAIIGLVNFFVKPFVKIISFPLRLLTFGLFSFFINIGLIWLVLAVIFGEKFEIDGIMPFVFTAVLIWLFNFIFNLKKSWKT